MRRFLRLSCAYRVMHIRRKSITSSPIGKLIAASRPGWPRRGPRGHGRYRVDLTSFPPSRFGWREDLTDRPPCKLVPYFRKQFFGGGLRRCGGGLLVAFS